MSKQTLQITGQNTINTFSIELLLPRSKYIANSNKYIPWLPMNRIESDSYSNIQRFYFVGELESSAFDLLRDVRCLNRGAIGESHGGNILKYNRKIRWPNGDTINKMY